MNVLYFIIGWIIGLFFSSIGMSQIFACIFCAIPITVASQKSGETAQYSKIYMAIARTIILWLVVCIAVFYAIYTYAPAFLRYGFYIEAGFMAVIVLGKSGLTASNMDDYCRVYKRYYESIENETIKTEKEKHVRFCKYCGQPIDENKKCTGCGKQYFHLPRIQAKYIAYTCMLIMIVALGATSLYLCGLLNELSVENGKLQQTIISKDSTYTDLKNENNSLHNTLNSTKKQCSELTTQMLNYKEESQYWDEYGALATENGKKYHTYSCKYIKNASGTIYVMTIWEAKEKGYTPCSECH